MEARGRTISDSMATFGVFTLWVVGAAVAMHLYDRSR